MDVTNVPHGAWILVADGAKALVLVNNGDPETLDLRVQEVFNLGDNPRSSEQGSDRPGHGQASMRDRRTSYEETDWHRIEEGRFARDVAAALDKHYAAKAFKWLAVFAPPQTLAELRKALSPQTRAHVVQEVAKDLTRHPISEIERILYDL